MSSSSLLLTLLISAFVLSIGAQETSLEAIQSQIEQQNVLSKSVLGNDSSIVWELLVKAFDLGESLVLQNVHSEIVYVDGQMQLVVTAYTSFWGQDQINTTFIFSYAFSDQLGVFAQSVVTLKSVPSNLLPSSAQSWYEFSFSENVVAYLSSSNLTTQNGDKYAEGVTLSSSFVLDNSNTLNNQLMNLLNVDTVTGDILAIFPFDGSAPRYTMNLDSDIYFENPVYISDDTQINFYTTGSASATLTSVIQFVNLGAGNQTVVFDATADISSEDGFHFQAAQQNAWNNVFGLSWLTFTDFTVDFAYTTNWTSTQFNFDGNANFAFAGGVTAETQFQTTLTNTDVSLVVTVPITSTTELCDSVLGSSPQYADQVSISGEVILTLSTYTYDTTEAGLSIFGSATIGGSGDLADAISNITSSALNFNLDFFAPVFSQNPEEITFTLTETSPITVTDSVSLSGLNLNFVMVPAPLTTIQTTISINVDQNPTVKFPITSIISGQGLKFNTVQQGVWNSAFGLDWLTLKNVALTFTVTDGWTSTSFAFNGLGVFNFSSGITANVSFSMVPTQTSVLLISNLPFSNLDSFFQSSIGQSPLYVDQVALNGLVTLVISTAKTSKYQSGVTLTASASIDGSGQLVQVANSLANLANSTGFTSDLSLNLYVPVFSQIWADMIFELDGSASIQFTPNFQLKSSSFQFAIEPQQTASFTGELLAQLANQENALQFDVEADLTLSELSFEGSMPGNWTSAFGMSWLSLSNISTGFDLNLTSGAVSNFDIVANIALSFGETSFASTIHTAENLFDYVIVMNVMIPEASSFLSAAVSGSSIPDNLNSITFLGTLTLASYSSSGSFQQGLTFTGTGYVNPSTDLFAILRSVDPSGTFSYDINLFIPQSNVAMFNFTIEQAGTVQLTDSISLDGFDLFVSVLPTASMSLQTTATIGLNQQPSSLQFSLDAEVAQGSDLTFNGALIGSWVNPFGVTWLSIDHVRSKLAFQEGQVSSLTFDALALFNFTTDLSALNVSLAAADNFADVLLQANDVTIISIDDVTRRIAGQTPVQVSSLNSMTNVVDITLSTYTSASSPSSLIFEGLSITDVVTLQGNLSDVLQVFNSFHQINNEQFELGLTIPIFEGQGSNIHFQLVTSQIQVTKQSEFTGIAIIVDTVPVNIEFEAGYLVNFTNNPELEFAVSGTFSPDGSIAINGDMVGTWENMFGISNFDISNVDIELGFNPSLCAVDFCISELGLGYTLGFADEQIKFYGEAQAPYFVDVFLEGSIGGSDGYIFTFQEIVNEWDALVGNDSDIAINPNDIPVTWGIKNTAFYVATSTGTFDNINYSPGFFVDGGFYVIGINCTVDVEIEENNYEFDIQINYQQFWQALRDELAYLLDTSPSSFNWTDSQRNEFLGWVGGVPGNYDDEEILGIRQVSIGNMTTYDIGAGSGPTFNMDYVFFGYNGTLSVGIGLYDLYSDFDSFFYNYLESAFYSVF